MEFFPKKREAERLAKETSDGVLLMRGEPEFEHYRRYLESREGEDSCRLERERHEIELKLAIGKAGGLKGLATWKSHEVKRFDEATFKKAEPKLYEEFVRISFQRTFRLL